MLIAALAVAVPSLAHAAGAIGQARTVSAGGTTFDGGLPRPEEDLVTAGTPGKPLTPAEVAKEEQARANARRRSPVASTTGPDAEFKEPPPSKWFTAPLVYTGVKGALIGLLIGSLFFPAGLILGPLVGAVLFYGLQKHANDKAEKAEAAG